MSEWASIRLESIMYDSHSGSGYRVPGLASYFERLLDNQNKIIELLTDIKNPEVYMDVDDDVLKITIDRMGALEKRLMQEISRLNSALHAIAEMTTMYNALSTKLQEKGLL